MATYIRGNAVENATSYELYKKVGEEYIKLDTQDSINFNLDELNLEPGDYMLTIKAKAVGYDDSEHSNEIFYRVTA